MAFVRDRLGKKFVRTIIDSFFSETRLLLTTLVLRMEKDFCWYFAFRFRTPAGVQKLFECIRYLFFIHYINATRLFSLSLFFSLPIPFSLSLYIFSNGSIINKRKPLSRTCRNAVK